METHRYIAIEGVIGVGKTTLARLLQPRYRAGVLLEQFEENPFLADFYADRAKYAFQTQIVFLLSRYRQQHRVIPRLLGEGHVISDYMFAKDRIFAHVNLFGDELATYERLHAILAENVPQPDLIVFLDADVPVIVQRIAQRDRSFERQIDPAYLESLRRAYRDYLANEAHGSALIINTNDLDVVRNPQHLDEVAGRIQAALGEGIHQPQLPQLGGATPLPEPRARPQAAPSLAPDLRRLPAAGDQTTRDPFTALLRLQEDIGRLGGRLVQAWGLMVSQLAARGNPVEALDDALRGKENELEPILADALGELFSLADAIGIDLQGALQRQATARQTHLDEETGA